MLWICTKCSLHFKHRSIFDKHLSSIEHAETGQGKEEPTCDISQLPTLTIPPVPNTTKNLHLEQTSVQNGQVKDEKFKARHSMMPSTCLQPTSMTIPNSRGVKRPFDWSELMSKKVKSISLGNNYDDQENISILPTPETSFESTLEIFPQTTPEITPVQTLSVPNAKRSPLPTPETSLESTPKIFPLPTSETSPVSTQNEALESSNAKLTPIVSVMCNGMLATMDTTKFESGSKGKSIQLGEEWLTPNEFEKRSGSRSKKYVESIQCQGRPLKYFVDNGELKGLGMKRVNNKILPITVNESNTLDTQTAVQISISEEGIIQPIVPIPYINHPNNQVEPAHGPINGVQGVADSNTPNPSGKPSVECDICHIELAPSTNLNRHRKIHFGDKPHKCPYCNKGFIQRYNMKVHIKTHRLKPAQGNL